MKMKVCQCWDDGIVNDIRLTGMLREHGAKATFNLNTGCMGETRGKNVWVGHDHRGWSYHGFSSGKLALRDIAEVYDGFEVASHCSCHQNAGAMADDEWIAAALEARHVLEDIVQRPCRGFAWPCGRYTPETIRLLRENGFAYGRTTENTYDVTKNKEPLALATNCHFQACDFWDRFERARETGVFYFWGHSYEMYEYDGLWDSLEDKIRTISQDPGCEWVDVIDIVPLLGR